MEFMQLMDNWDQYRPVSQSRVSEAALCHFVDLLANRSRMPRHRHQYLLMETITSSDFPNLLGLTLQMELMARSRLVIADWQAYCAQGKVQDFNLTDLHKVDGNEGLLPLVVEKGEYTQTPMLDSRYHKQVLVYGKKFDISWRAIVNDALGAFSDLPQRWADAVTYTRAMHVTQLHTQAAGPNVGLFGAPIADVDGANVTNQGVLPLTIANLATTLNLMAAQQDSQGKPLSIVGAHLVVPPLLKFTALQILNSTTIIDAAAAIPTGSANIMSQLGIKLHVDPLLPVVDTSGNRNGTWYVFADPLPGGRAAMEMDFLRGQEDPEICMKASNKVPIGGGAELSPMTGDFDSDNIIYRVRDVHGGVRLDPRYAYAQVNV